MMRNNHLKIIRLLVCILLILSAIEGGYSEFTGGKNRGLYLLRNYAVHLSVFLAGWLFIFRLKHAKIILVIALILSFISANSFIPFTGKLLTGNLFFLTFILNCSVATFLIMTSREEKKIATESEK
ncbi:MAG TPA: hypothetical protein P5239_09730 [Victivallales bacterium]|nr:hypothetical protein [Victivallales bacterium]HRU01968.1 hypothetical protein [Victivallales bacterium]